MQIWIKEGGSEWWDCKEKWNGKHKVQTLSVLLKRAAQGTAQSQPQSAKLHFHQLPFMCFLTTDVYFKVTLIQPALELLLNSDSYKSPGILCVEQAFRNISKISLSNT